MQRIFVVLVILLAVSSLMAIPYAVLGNINMPDAYVLPSKMMEVSFTNYFVAAGNVMQTADSLGSMYSESKLYNYGLSASVGLFDKIELGIVYGNLNGATLIYGNAKLRLYSETEKFPSIAVGLENIFSDMDNTDDPYPSSDFTDPRDYIKNSPYIVGSKSTLLLTDIPYFEHLETTLHFGIGGGRFIGRRSKVKDLHGAFGGVDLKPNKYVSLNAEIDSQNLNVGLNVYYKKLTVRACVYRLEDYFKAKESDNYGQKFAIGLKYTIDKYSEVKASDKDKAFHFNVTPKVKKKSLGTLISEDNNIQNTDTTNPLLEELKLIRERRQQAEKELEEIKKLLQQ